MKNEEVAPETRGVTAEVLATVDLAGEIEGMAGRQLRMRMVTMEPGGIFGPIHDHVGRPGTVYILQERSLIIETASLRTMGPERAGPRTGTRSTGSKTGERFRPWRSRSISSTKNELRARSGALFDPGTEQSDHFVDAFGAPVGSALCRVDPA